MLMIILDVVVVANLCQKTMKEVKSQLESGLSTLEDREQEQYIKVMNNNKRISTTTTICTCRYIIIILVLLLQGVP